MNGTRNRYPFTASQWQELEHQALIYKYMASGISIPPDLLFTIKKSYLQLPHQPQHIGWNYLQMGLGRKIDPEPGRCRRTDGKKWRCSKEAYPDSKYCERHMHRGKNRSRKPVEVLKTATATNTDTNIKNSTLSSSSSSLTPTTAHHSLSPLSSLSSHDPYHHPPPSYASSFLYHHNQPPSSSRSSSSAIGLSFQENNNNSGSPFFLDNNNNDCRDRYVYGLKEEVDEHAFFTEPSGTMRSFSSSSMVDDSCWQLTPLTISSSSSSSSKQRSCSALSNENDYSSYLQLHHTQQQQAEQDHHQFMKLANEEPQKTVHRFFDEWPPPKNRGSWLDLDDKSSTTQLSISIPASSHDFAAFSSRNQRDG